MRALLLVLILVVVAVILAVATNLINIRQTQGAEVPAVGATANGVSAKGGQAPKFDIETGSVKVGTTDAKVRLPTVKVEPPAGESGSDNAQAPATNASGM